MVRAAEQRRPLRRGRPRARQAGERLWGWQLLQGGTMEQAPLKPAPVRFIL